MIQIPGFMRSVATFIDDIPGVYVPQEDLENTISSLAMNTVLISASALFILTVLAMLFSKKYEKIKMPLFVLMAIAMAGSTLTLIGSTVYLNTQSDSGGPVHWHADMEFWACGNELELRDPTGFLSNKIGTATLHEHDDHRIHLEGVVVDDEVDASLGKFMHVVGGAITAEQLVIPLNDDDNGDGNIFEDEEDGDGPAETDAAALEPYISEDVDLGRIANFKDGDTCNGQVSDVQVFVYQLGEDDTYEQIKLDNPRDYVITDDPNVPPGDCVIFEFGPERDKTDKLCEQYGIRDIDRCEQFGVGDNQRAICELTQVNFANDDTLPSESSLEESLLNPAESEPLNEDEIDPIEVVEGVDAVHIDPSTEQLRLDCEATGDSESTECVAYQERLDSDPGAQAEADAAADATVTDDELVESTEQAEEGGAN